MHLSPHEAASALAHVEDARATMRHVIRAHRGHYQLWIWGFSWVAMPLTAYIWGDYAARYFTLICFACAIPSAWVGFTQARQIRIPPNLRIMGAVGALVIFAALFPFVLRAKLDVRTSYAYLCLVAMQAYVIAGIWTDSYLLWVGIIVTALLLAGIFFFPGMFWLWMAVFGGGSLIATGFYVRHFWR